MTADLLWENFQGEHSCERAPALARALALCRVHNATLVIAKLDRLARNVYFISGLMESTVDFVAVDFPQANRLQNTTRYRQGWHGYDTYNNTISVRASLRSEWLTHLVASCRAKHVSAFKLGKLQGSNPACSP
jgi:hypothetical protein